MGNLRIQKFMSPAPYIVGDTHTLEYAAKLMSQHGIRHLPVLSGGQLVGVLSSEETRAALMANAAPGTLVREAMNRQAYWVGPDTPLEDVALEMANKRHAIAVVMKNGHVVGVFTTVDGLRALSTLAAGEGQGDGARSA